MSSDWLTPEQYIATLPRATVYSCFYVTDQQDRPLQLRAVENPSLWKWPGGNLEHGETPWACAVRECAEETGLDLGEVTQRLLGVHFLPPVGTWTVHKVGFLFDGGRLTPEQIDGIVLDPDEHSEVVVKPLEEWCADMDGPSFERLAAVAGARRAGAVYLEHPHTA